MRFVLHVPAWLFAAAGLAALGLPACSDNGGNEQATETFRSPPELRASGGELRATLRVSTERVEVDGQAVTTTVYNGQYVPPLLRLAPGDTLFLDLDNRAATQTNQHYHGLNVSPRINPDATVSDNVFVHIEPGSKLDYRVAIPPRHNPGLYWYHSHQHGNAEQQVMGGLSGGLVIEGVLDSLPELAGIKERVMLLKDIQIGPDGRVPDAIDSSAPTHRTVNGQTNPVLTIAPGETQFLRIANIGANLYYRLKLDGHVLYELARDGNRRNRLVPMDELLLPPASRSEVLIQGAQPGRYALKALAFDTGPAGDSSPEALLATLVSQGPARTPIALPGALPAVEDLRALPVARRRTITFDESDDGNTFFIDSGDGPRQFDPNRVDSTIVAGTVEEWTVLNATQELHVFHIHQTDFQVTEIDGVAQPFTGHQDNVNVPYQPGAAAPPGQVKLLIDFRNPLIVGRFVYHCHILEHEDGGMMAVAEVVSPSAVAKVVPPGALADAVPPGALAEAGAWTRRLARLVGSAVDRLWSRNDAAAATRGKQTAATPDKTPVSARSELTLAAAQAGSLCRSDGSPRQTEASASPRRVEP